MKKMLLAIAMLLAVAAPAHADLDFVMFATTGQNATTRYEYGDIVNIYDISPIAPFNYSDYTLSPFFVIRVITTRTKSEVMEYLTPKTTGQARRRQYYFDINLMSAEDRLTLTTYHAIKTTEAVALTWISKK